MGSSGGGYSNYGSGGLGAQERASAKNAQSSQIEMEINQFLDSLLKEINARDADAIRTHIAEIEKALGKEIDGLDTLLYGGSLSKSTFVEGMSVVDALVFFDKESYQNTSPRDLQDKMFSLLKTRYPNTEIKKGTLAVTVKFKDYEVQLLPALRDQGKIRIANRENNSWSGSINSKAFSERLTKTNQLNGNKVVPVVKLAKAMLAKVPERYRPSGYHVEALAVDAFASYSGRYTLFDMTKHMLNHCVKRVLSPMHDVTGQSDAIDSYWGQARSIDRQIAARHIRDLAGRFSASKAVSVTKELFSEVRECVTSL